MTGSTGVSFQRGYEILRFTKEVKPFPIGIHKMLNIYSQVRIRIHHGLMFTVSNRMASTGICVGIHPMLCQCVEMV
jgi:hypothetical protein